MDLAAWVKRVIASDPAYDKDIHVLVDIVCTKLNDSGISQLSQLTDMSTGLPDFLKKCGIPAMLALLVLRETAAAVTFLPTVASGSLPPREASASQLMLVHAIQSLARSQTTDIRFTRHIIIEGASGAQRSNYALQLLDQIVSRVDGTEAAQGRKPLLCTYHNMRTQRKAKPLPSETLDTAYEFLLCLFVQHNVRGYVPDHDTETKFADERLALMLSKWKIFRRVEDSGTVAAVWVVVIDTFEFDPPAARLVLRAAAAWNDPGYRAHFDQRTEPAAVGIGSQCHCRVLIVPVMVGSSATLVRSPDFSKYCPIVYNCNAEVDIAAD